MTLLLDVSFNDDGTASDVSGHNIDITTMAGPGLCTYWSEAAGKQIPRKYYEITPDGKDALSDMQKVWEKISAGIGRMLRSDSPSFHDT